MDDIRAVMDAVGSERAAVIGESEAGRADAGEVLVSSTVNDLVAGSGLEFEDRGTAALKGVPGEWRTFGVVG